MDHLLDNRKFLHERLFAGELHQSLEALFANGTAEDLSRLFRNHAGPGNGVYDPKEVATRRQMDEWLAEVSLIYLAGFSGYAARSAGTAYGERILKILGHASLRPFYERYYPIALPWLFRLELEDEVAIEAEQAPGAFEFFANLYERFRNDRELACFLDYLDGFAYGAGEARVSVETVVEAFGNPDRVVQAVFRPQAQMTPLDAGIVGLLRFATFSTSLHELLQKCDAFPVLRSAFWFFYAFWYREFHKDVKALSVGAIQTAAGSVRDKGSQALASQSEQELTAIMTALTDGRYANALIEKVPAETLGTLSFETKSASSPKPGWASRFAAYRKT